MANPCSIAPDIAKYIVKEVSTYTYVKHCCYINIYCMFKQILGISFCCIQTDTQYDVVGEMFYL